MDRLTVWEHNDRGGKWSYHMDASVNDLCAKLAAYEDTSLTPDEIASLRAENERLRAALDYSIPVLEVEADTHDVSGYFITRDNLRGLADKARAALGKEEAK